MIVGFGLLILATFTMRVWWGRSIGRQTDALQHEFQARGEPLTFAELPLPPRVAPDDDAVALYVKAASLDAANSPASGMGSYPAYLPFGPLWEQAAIASEQANQALFKLTRQARDRRSGQFPPYRLDTEAETLAALTPLSKPDVYNQLRQIFNTVGDGVILKHIQGDDLEAVERLLDLQHLATITTQDPTLVAQLVAIGIWAGTCQRIHVVGPGLRLDDPAVVKRVRELIQTLLRDDPEHVARWSACSVTLHFPDWVAWASILARGERQLVFATGKGTCPCHTPSSRGTGPLPRCGGRGAW